LGGVIYRTKKKPAERYITISIVMLNLPARSRFGKGRIVSTTKEGKKILKKACLPTGRLGRPFKYK
jgi:hypothetical protein